MRFLLLFFFFFFFASSPHFFSAALLLLLRHSQLSTGRGLFVRKRQRNSVVIPRLDPLVVKIADLGIHLSQSAAVEEEAKRARAGFREVPTMEAVDCSDFPPKSPEVEAMLEGLLALNPLFKRLERSERKLVYRAFFECRYAAGEIIMREGDIGDVFYILVGGQCHTAGESPDHVLRYQPGDSFGELALIYGTARPSTVVASKSLVVFLFYFLFILLLSFSTSPPFFLATDCVLWGLQRNAYRQTLQGITSAHREKYLTFLKRFPLLSGLRNDHLRLIADCLESVEFDEGQSIIRQGDAGEEFFLVLSGEVEVRKREADSEREVGILKEGDYFGEIALLTDLPRQASCIARGGPVSCAMLRREDFLRVLPEETTSKMCEEFLPKIQQPPPPK